MTMQFRLEFNQAKKMFFDRAKIKQKVDVRTRKVLSKFGAFVRQTSRKSIRKRKGTSRPGRPPFSHTGVLKRFIYFGYDKDRRSVVIGPVIAHGKVGKAPQALEHGGTVTLLTGKTANMAARPFMQPAFESELKNVPKLWVDSIR